MNQCMVQHLATISWLSAQQPQEQPENKCLVGKNMLSGTTNVFIYFMSRAEFFFKSRKSQDVK